MRYLFLFLLAACTAAEQSPCARQCNHVFDSCMETGSSRMSSSYALEALELQCSAGQGACVNACQQQVQP